MGLAGSCSWGGPLGSRRSTGRTIGITESGHSMLPRLSPAPHSACTCVSFHIALILFLQRRLCHMVRIMAPGNPNLEIPVKKKKGLPFSTAENRSQKRMLASPGSYVLELQDVFL